jgi:hypothetical protein
LVVKPERLRNVPEALTADVGEESLHVVAPGFRLTKNRVARAKDNGESSARKSFFTRIRHALSTASLLVTEFGHES